MIGALAATPRAYTIQKRNFLIHDELSPEQNIDFHVAQGDYFPTLATIIGLLSEFLSDAVANGETPRGFEITTLERLKKDLMYLHRRYKIVSKFDGE